ncbi:MAG: thiolase family protein [Candidatus Puniceispirillales bacterium]|tara:strand:+ start:989 stop:2128 length:1140 start_codon:yes stop_codon:yes gene_type:complete
MHNAVIAGYTRSPFTVSFKGGLKSVRPEDMLSQVIKSLISNVNLNKDDIEDVIVGCAFPEGEQGFNIGKVVTFMCDLPRSVAGMTVNRWCGSSMQSIHNAAGSIAMGSGKVFICAGVESMTRVPMLGFNPMPHPELLEQNPNVYLSMGVTAENVAKKYNIDRTQQQEFAISSHEKANNADTNGKFEDEITIIKDKKVDVMKDGGIRPGTNQEVLSGLKLAFDNNGTVTAGTSSPLTDGAAATLICEEEYAKSNNLEILARIKSTAVNGCEPEVMGLGPIGASKKALSRAGLKSSDLDIIELNEAFASQSLACVKDLELDEKSVNIDGGAIALGHPLGATGARITGKAAQLLKREGKKFALATQCIGLGQGIATVLEAVE